MKKQLSATRMHSILSRGPVPMVPPGAVVWLEQPADDPAEPKIYTVAEAASAIGVGLTTVKALIKSGELPSIMIRARRVVRREAIDAYLSRRESGKSRGR